MRYVAPLLVMLMVGPLFAQGGTTLFGGSGGAVLPTADVLGRRLFDVSLDWLVTDGDDAVPGRIVYGAGENWEIGGMADLNDFGDVWGLNAKLGTRLLSSGGGGTALGFQFIEVDDFDADGWQVYAVHTRPLTTLGRATVRGSLGVNWTNIDTFDFDEDAFRLFGSLEGVFDNGFTLGVEMQSGSGDLGDDGPLSSVYGRYRYNDRWTLQAGLTNTATGGLTSSDDHDLFLGASYAFGALGSRRATGGAYSVTTQ